MFLVLALLSPVLSKDAFSFKSDLERSQGVAIAKHQTEMAAFLSLVEMCDCRRAVAAAQAMVNQRIKV